MRIHVRRAYNLSHRNIVLVAEWQNPNHTWHSHSWEIDKFKNMKEQFHSIGRDIVAKQIEGKKLDRAQELGLQTCERILDNAHDDNAAFDAEQMELTFEDLEDLGLFEESVEVEDASRRSKKRKA